MILPRRMTAASAETAASIGGDCGCGGDAGETCGACSARMCERCVRMHYCTGPLWPEDWTPTKPSGLGQTYPQSPKEIPEHAGQVPHVSPKTRIRPGAGGKLPGLFS